MLGTDTEKEKSRNQVEGKKKSKEMCIWAAEGWTYKARIIDEE